MIPPLKKRWCTMLCPRRRKRIARTTINRHFPTLSQRGFSPEPVGLWESYVIFFLQMRARGAGKPSLRVVLRSSNQARKPPHVFYGIVCSTGWILTDPEVWIRVQSVLAYRRQGRKRHSGRQAITMPKVTFDAGRNQPTETPRIPLICGKFRGVSGTRKRATFPL